MAKKAKAEEQTNERRAEEVHRAIHEAIKDLGRHDAIEVLGMVADSCNAQVEGLEEELREEEEG